MRVTVSFVRRQLGWPESRASMSRQKYTTQQWLEGRRFVLLAWSDINSQDNATLTDQEMHFGAEAAA